MVTIGCHKKAYFSRLKTASLVPLGITITYTVIIHINSNRCYARCFVQIIQRVAIRQNEPKAKENMFWYTGLAKVVDISNVLKSHLLWEVFTESS